MITSLVALLVTFSTASTTRFEDGASQTQEFGSGSGPLHGFGGAIDDELDSKLRAAIALPDAPAIESTLDANIRDHLDLEDWRLAVVETAVLFEARIATFLRARFAANGVAVADVDAKFVEPNGRPRSVTYLAKTLVLEATGFDFAATAEYSRWKSAVRDLRNTLFMASGLTSPAQRLSTPTKQRRPQ
jgi:hypothetical protein